MKTYVVLIFIYLLITGCTTVDFVRKDFTPQKQGVLRYDPPSSEKSREKYRAEVDKKATAFCGGDYRITKEYQAREESGVSTGVGTGMSVGMGGVFLGGSNRATTMYNFVEFACL